MLSAPDKTNLPAHSRDVCPWGTTCPVHARPTFADERRTATIKANRARKTRRQRNVRALKPCHFCAGPRLEKNLRAYVRGVGHQVPVCAACKPDSGLARVPRWLQRDYRQKVPA